MLRKSKLWKVQKRYLERSALTLRPNTVLNARSATSGFIRYLEKLHPELSSFGDLERRHIEGWLSHLARRRLKRSTRRNQIIKIRRFLETLQDYGGKEAPPLELIRRGDAPVEDRGLPRPLSHDTDRALQQELRRRGATIHKALLLMRSTGLRRQELLDLKVDSLTTLPRGQYALHVPLGKLHDERVLPIDEETAELFKDLSKLRRSPPRARDPETGKLAEFLLVRPDGRRFSPDAFRYHLGKIEKEAGLQEHATPHRLRHSFATEMLRAGMRLPVLMKLLGHRTIAMTLRYAEVTGIDVRRAYLETIAAIENRYEIPPLPATVRAANKSTSWHSVVSQLQALAREIENLRRNLEDPPRRKTVRRLVERLRRLARDFALLTS